MKIVKVLSEARRNPSVNAKIASFMSHLSSIVDQVDKLPNGESNAFISFATLNKIGIRPFPSDTSTPVGIYAYSLDFILEKYNTTQRAATGVHNSRPADDMTQYAPYAADFPVINVLSIKDVDKTLFLGDNEQLDEFSGKVIEFFRTNTFENISSEYVVELFKSKASGKNPYAVFQSMCVNYLKISTQKMSIALLKMGYTAIYDDTYKSIIAFEKKQIVFLNQSAAVHHSTHMNKYVTHNGIEGDWGVHKSIFINNNIRTSLSPLRDLGGRVGVRNAKSLDEIREALRNTSDANYKFGTIVPEMKETMQELSFLGTSNWRDKLFHFQTFLRRAITTMKYLNKLSSEGLISKVDGADEMINACQNIIEVCSEVLPIINGSKFKQISGSGESQQIINQGIADLLLPVVGSAPRSISDDALRSTGKTKTMYELRSLYVMQWLIDHIINFN